MIDSDTGLRPVRVVTLVSMQKKEQPSFPGSEGHFTNRESEEF